MRLALYQPDIPQNTGTLLRLCACLGVALDIIEPCGFLLNDTKLKRAMMDYVNIADLQRHANWDDFYQHTAGRRLVLLSTKAEKSYLDFHFEKNDILLAGRESAGVPDDVRDLCAASVLVPMVSGARSINVAVASSLVLGEALRQTGLFPQHNDVPEVS